MRQVASLAACCRRWSRSRRCAHAETVRADSSRMSAARRSAGRTCGSRGQRPERRPSSVGDDVPRSATRACPRDTIDVAGTAANGNAPDPHTRLRPADLPRPGRPGPGRPAFPLPGADLRGRLPRSPVRDTALRRARRRRCRRPLRAHSVRVPECRAGRGARRGGTRLCPTGGAMTTADRRPATLSPRRRNARRHTRARRLEHGEQLARPNLRRQAFRGAKHDAKYDAH